MRRSVHSGGFRFTRSFLLLAAMAIGGLGGCTSTTQDTLSDAGGLGIGGAVGAATGNPVLAVVAGLGATVALDEGYRYGERRFYGDFQREIARAGGRAAIGTVAAWTYEGPLDIGDARGRVEPVRRFGETLRCRLIIYTLEPLAQPPAADEGRTSRAVTPVDTETPLPDEAEVYTTTICRTPDGWRWAQSRPSTSRWGGIQ